MEKSPDIFGFIWDPQTGGSQKALNFGQIVEKKKFFQKKFKNLLKNFKFWKFSKNFFENLTFCPIFDALDNNF